MHYLGHQTSLTNPLRGVAMYRTVESVMDSSPAAAVRFELGKAARDVRAERGRYVFALQGLRAANRRPLRWMKGGTNCRLAMVGDDYEALAAAGASCRRAWQGRAMRALNAARRAARQAEARLAHWTAEAARLTADDEKPTRRFAMAA